MPFDYKSQEGLLAKITDAEKDVCLGDVLVSEDQLERLGNYLQDKWGKSSAEKINSICYKVTVKHMLHINVYVLNKETKGLFSNIVNVSKKLDVCEISGIGSFRYEYRSVPVEYSWNRAMSSFDLTKIVNFYQTGKDLDFNDLEPEFTEKVKLSLPKYTPIDYNWMELNSLKERQGLTTDMFEGPFLIKKDELNIEIVNQISTEMLARTIYLKSINHKSTVPVSMVAITDFIKRTGISHITDLAKRHLNRCISKINNETLKTINEKVLIRKGKSSNVAWN